MSAWAASENGFVPFACGDQARTMRPARCRFITEAVATSSGGSKMPLGIGFAGASAGNILISV
ncbi:MAG: hypothetical protein C4334_11695 [Pyrinomonas sp.]